MNKVHKTVEQECDSCGKHFYLRYCSDGTYEYRGGEVCDCLSTYHPVNGELSISEWIEYLKWRCIMEKEPTIQNQKRVLQISLDIVVGCECDGTELADDISDELNRRGFTIIGAGFQEDMTKFYEEHYPDLFPN